MRARTLSTIVSQVIVKNMAVAAIAMRDVVRIIRNQAAQQALDRFAVIQDAERHAADHVGPGHTDFSLNIDFQ